MLEIHKKAQTTLNSYHPNYQTQRPIRPVAPAISGSLTTIAAFNCGVLTLQFIFDDFHVLSDKPMMFINPQSRLLQAHVNTTLHPTPSSDSLLNNSYQNPPSVRETVFNRDFHLKMFTSWFYNCGEDVTQKKT